MTLAPTPVMTANWASDPITVAPLRSNFAISASKAVYSGADGSGGLLGANTPRPAQAVRCVMAVQDGAGLFCSTDSGGSGIFSSGIFFEIKYFGAETLLTLRARNPSLTSVNGPSGATIGVAEALLPSWMSRGATFTFFLNVNRYGWCVSALRGSTPVPLLELVHPLYSTVNPHQGGSGIPALLLDNASNVSAGFYATKNGVSCSTLMVAAVPIRGDSGQGFKTIYEDQFVGSPAVAGQYGAIPDGAAVADTAQAQFLTQVGPYKSGGALYAPNTGALEIVSPALGSATFEQQAQHVLSTQTTSGGQPAIKVTIGGSIRHIYLNSDIATPGTFRAVTIETNGTA